MATFPTITQRGGSVSYFWFGGNITNHEVFAFTLQFADFGVGALITNVTVFENTDFVAGQTSYEMTLTVVDEFLRPLPSGTGFIRGNFESNGV